MYLFLLGILFGSGAVLAFQELRRQVMAKMDEWVQAETDRRLVQSTQLTSRHPSQQDLDKDLAAWGYEPKPKPKDTTISEYDARWAGDNGATIASTPDDEW